MKKRLVNLPSVSAAGHALATETQHLDKRTGGNGPSDGVAAVIAEILQLDLSDILKDTRYPSLVIGGTCCHDHVSICA